MKKLLIAMCLVVGMGSGVMAAVGTFDSLNVGTATGAGVGEIKSSGGFFPGTKVGTYGMGLSNYVDSWLVIGIPGTSGTTKMVAITKSDGTDVARFTADGNVRFYGSHTIGGSLSWSSAVNSVINAPNSVIINLDSDNNSTEMFRIDSGKDNANEANNLFKVEESGNISITNGNLYMNQAKKLIFTSTGQSSGFNRGELAIDGSRVWTFSNGLGRSLMALYGDGTKIGTLEVSAGNLIVNGTVTAKEVLVKTNVWSDYVFEPSYRLMPLSELESYVKKNKHLPEVPTEAEVKKDGVNVGDVQAKLLAKIEELTLYMIEQNKQLKQQAKQIAELQEKCNVCK